MYVVGASYRQCTMKKCSAFVVVSLGADGIATNLNGLDPLSSQGDTERRASKGEDN